MRIMASFYMWMISVWLLTVVSSNTLAQTSPEEARSVLIDLYNSTAGKDWTNPWPVNNINSNICGWSGVSCDSGDIIIGLDLFQRGLQGTLPRSLGNLTQMQNFTASSNNISGTLPKELSAWSSLKCIDLGNNSINGTLPPAYASWNASLQTFIVRNNTLTGSLPGQFGVWSSSSFVLFDVSNNNINGILPINYSHWSSLLTFVASRNRLRGSIPTTYSNWRQLQAFVIKGNQVDGTLSSSFGTPWRGILFFSVSNNDLNGSLPTEFQNWTSIVQFLVGSNRLSGTIPASFSGWVNCASFDISDNLLSGTIPPGLATFHNLLSFNAPDNQLSGSVSSQFQNWTQLLNFNVHSNQLSGTLPSELSSWENITTFVIYNNSFNGTLPKSYMAWTKIFYFHARINRLSGTLPEEYSVFGGVQLFTLSFNLFTGTVPSKWMSGLHNVALFDVSSNQLSGPLPSTLPPSLVAVLFDNNNFTGNLPNEWSHASLLGLLGLQGNLELCGPTPSSWVPTLFATTPGCASCHFGGLLSLCDTSVCTPSIPSPLNLYNQNFICFPTPNRDVVYNIAGVSPAQLLATFFQILQAVHQSANFTGGSICNHKSMTISLREPPASNPPTPAPPSSEAALTWSLFDASEKSTAVVTTASSGAGLFSGGAGGGDAGDAQMLAAVLSSSCVCGFNASSSASSSGGASVMSFATSPFSLLADPIYVAIGNPMIALALFLVQLLLVSRRLQPTNRTATTTDFEHRELGESLHTQQQQQQQRQSESVLQRIAKMLQLKLQFTCPDHHHTYPFDHSRQRQAPADNCCSCASIRAQYRFPNFSIAIAMFLAPGVVGAVVRTCISTPASIASASPVGLRIFGILIGACFLLGLMFVIEFVVFREMVEKGFVRVSKGNNRSTPECLHSSGRRNRTLKSDSPTPPSHAHSGGTITREPRLRFKLYKNAASSFAPIPRTVAEYCLPNGHWFPQSERLAIGGIVGSMDPARSSFRAWLWLFTANCVTQLVASLPFDALADPTSCDAAQIILVLVAFGCAALIALRRPFRFLLMSAVNSVTLVLVGCVSILQMACRRTPEHVSQTDLSGYTTFVSIVLLLSKLYLVGAQFLEGFLATKNNVASVVQDVSRTPPHLRPEFQIHGSSLDMRSKTPHHQQQQQQLTTSPQQSSSGGDTLINPSLVSSSTLTLLPGSIAMSLSPQHATTGRSVRYESQAMRVVEWGSMTQVEALEKLICIVCSYD